MKTNSLIFLLTTFFLGSCNKDSFRIKDITETDNNGNYVGNRDNTDWQLQNLKEMNNIEDGNIIGLNLIGTLLVQGMGINVNTLKFDCSDTAYHFELIAYPNPVPKGGKVNFKINSNINFNICVAAAINAKKNIMYQSFSSINAQNNFSSPLQTSVSEDKDFSLYYLMMTPDSCIYVGRGDIKVK